MKKAFTLLELAIVIVIVGILTTTVISRMNSNNLANAAIKLMSDIRYTQHLAIVNDKYDTQDTTWYKERWQLLFGRSSAGTINSGGYYAYTIFSDAYTKTGNPDPNEIAKNYLDNSKLLSGGFGGSLDWEDEKVTKELNIGYKYGIDNVTQSGCGAKRISFDHMGRPLKGNSSSWTSATSGLLKSQCKFTLHKDTDSIVIAIEAETGYAHIL